MVGFYIEYSLLHSVPVAIQRMSISSLSLVGNLITAVPDLPDQFSNLMPSLNPITTFPTTIAHMAALTYLDLGQTLIDKVPDWIPA